MIQPVAYAEKSYLQYYPLDRTEPGGRVWNERLMSGWSTCFELMAYRPANIREREH